eukprot:gnl/Chilomastix_cuspidata/4156.p1 GENE.gnl/Chilomastix_cuspidata/4156~~gnl/Chilomastix_cuspidata/4156.p1  ORF type:complete len:774 (-),score=153.24 gnl/Chilomastix_cuspidata/4156:43-2364(-)
MDEAQAFLERHGIPNLLDDMTNALLFELPSNPTFAFGAMLQKCTSVSFYSLVLPPFAESEPSIEMYCNTNLGVRLGAVGTLPEDFVTEETMKLLRHFSKDFAGTSLLAAPEEIFSKIQATLGAPQTAQPAPARTRSRSRSRNQLRTEPSQSQLQRLEQVRRQLALFLYALQRQSALNLSGADAATAMARALDPPPEESESRDDEPVLNGSDTADPPGTPRHALAARAAPSVRILAQPPPQKLPLVLLPLASGFPSRELPLVSAGLCLVDTALPPSLMSAAVARAESLLLSEVPEKLRSAKGEAPTDGDLFAPVRWGRKAPPKDLLDALAKAAEPPPEGASETTRKKGKEESKAARTPGASPVLIILRAVAKAMDAANLLTVQTQTELSASDESDTDSAPPRAFLMYAEFGLGGMDPRFLGEVPTASAPSSPKTAKGARASSALPPKLPPPYPHFQFVPVAKDKEAKAAKGKPADAPDAQPDAGQYFMAGAPGSEIPAKEVSTLISEVIAEFGTALRLLLDPAAPEDIQTLEDITATVSRTCTRATRPEVFVAFSGAPARFSNGFPPPNVPPPLEAPKSRSGSRSGNRGRASSRRRSRGAPSHGETPPPISPKQPSPPDPRRGLEFLLVPRALKLCFLQEVSIADAISGDAAAPEDVRYIRALRRLPRAPGVDAPGRLVRSCAFSFTDTRAVVGHARHLFGFEKALPKTSDSVTLSEFSPSEYLTAFDAALASGSDVFLPSSRSDVASIFSSLHAFAASGLRRVTPSPYVQWPQ